MKLGHVFGLVGRTSEEISNRKRSKKERSSERDNTGFLGRGCVES